MARLTTHVLDTSAGIPASDMRIELHATDSAPPRLMTEFRTNADGRCERPLLEGASFKAGQYSLTFHVAEYFGARGVAVADPAVLVPVGWNVRGGRADEQ